jgi:hypothetical protein
MFANFSFVAHSITALGVVKTAPAIMRVAPLFVQQTAMDISDLLAAFSVGCG